MKAGTCTVSPVSSFAGLVTALAVALRIPGSVSITFSSTVCGSSMPTALPSKNSIVICSSGQILHGIAQNVPPKLHLLIILGVHEGKEITVRVQVFHLFFSTITRSIGSGERSDAQK